MFKKNIAKFFFLSFFILSISLLLSGCKKVSLPNQNDSNNKINIAVTIYPIQEFVSQVGQDKVNIIPLIPLGIEPHDWEPTPQDIKKLLSCQILFYNGAGLEPIDNILASNSLKQLQSVDLSSKVHLLQTNNHGIHKNHTHSNDHSSEHNNDKYRNDPHIWLNPLNAIIEVETIRDHLIALDPQNQDFYKNNATQYIKKLEQLDFNFQNTLSKLPKKEFITSHAAFAYLANRYQIKQLSVMGLSPDEEPTAEHMSEIIDLCKAKNIKYIFAETLVSPKLSETIAKEANATVLILNPLEALSAEDIKNGNNYINVMQENLKKLSIALQ